MALQLRNKVDKEKKDNTSKTGKYKRKRNVFGKRTARFGLIGTIIGLVVIFATIKIAFTLQQNKRQKNIDNQLASVEAMIAKYRTEIGRSTNSYENVGELIATLPTSFDQQATSLDLDRLVTLSGLTESTSAHRRISESSTLPFECSISTVKAVEIAINLIGDEDDIDSVKKFLKYITDYSHENFYYFSQLSYNVSRNDHRGTLTVTMYTFYNDIDLSQQ